MTTTKTEGHMDLTVRVAEEIRAMMARRRVTGAGLARALGVSDAWVSYRLNGKQAIDLNDLERIAEVLQVDAQELLPSRGDTEDEVDRRRRESRSVTFRYQPVAGQRGVRSLTRPGDTRPTNRPDGALAVAA